jgi:catechol 2,3-dioxygenase-like lactoylglutathione lyase family enzyme
MDEMSGYRSIHHVQLTMPDGGTPAARHFYGEVLGLPEVPVPPALTSRASAWFRDGTVEVHLGIESDFRPARKGHPAFEVENLEQLAARCNAAGFDVRFDPHLPGYRRFHVFDPFGNRLEFLSPAGI